MLNAVRARKLMAGLVGLSFSALSLNALAGEEAAALVRRLSQQFSDASAAGDAAVFARLLNDDVVFMNEGGEIATKADIIAGAQPARPGVKNELVQDDFHVVFIGDVAVTSFTDHATVHFFAQVMRPDFRSTEVWKKFDGGWQMISSQTMALPVDPPRIVVAAKALDGYAGVYQADPSFVIRVRRDGESLKSSTNGGAETILLCETPDVFFTAGQPRLRRIFQRDAEGRIVGFRSRREGMDLVFQRRAQT
jgi:ketosteroid isomerase-like protein